jgi:hypothetical protein
MSKKPQMGPFWFTPEGLSFTTGSLSFFLVDSAVLPVAVAVEDCVCWLFEDVGRGESGTGMVGVAGVAPHLPKTQPPTFLVRPGLEAT